MRQMGEPDWRWETKTLVRMLAQEGWRAGVPAPPDSREACLQAPDGSMVTLRFNRDWDGWMWTATGDGWHMVGAWIGAEHTASRLAGMGKESKE